MRPLKGALVILGIDPGLARTGYGVLRAQGRGVTYVAHGCITTPANQPFSARLYTIFDQMREVFETYKPSILAMERLFFAKNMKTATSVGQSQGVLFLLAHMYGAPVYEFTPPAVKMTITGSGAASKKQMQKMIKTLLKLREIPKPDDAADALAVAFCYTRTKKV